jgi:signal transduction histidine kinase
MALGVPREAWGFGRRPPLVGLAVAAATVAAVTALLYPLSELDPGVSSGVLYVLGVLLLTIHWGLWLGLVTSVASALSLGVFHGDLGNEGDLVAITVLLLTATVASVIADRARVRAEEAEEHLRLQDELRRRDAERIRLQEVSASRARVLAAADEERRRVVRDLHDGAQQRLVHAVVTLTLARGALGQEAGAADALLGEALHHAQRANAELRELARGILPSVLTRGGLRAGVQALASRMRLKVTVDVSIGRLPAAIEAAAYFVVAEALTNVAKHSSARSAHVSAWVESDVLTVAVRDDGVGGASRDGNGLLGLEDRLAALDGALRIEIPPGGGTLVAATIPLRAAGPRGAGIAAASVNGGARRAP